MTQEITLYTNPMSRGVIAHYMLEELGVPYRSELLDLEKNEHKRPAYLKLNPMGKVPTLVHGGVVITEAAAICAYLADAFPAQQLAPLPGDPLRGSYLRWMFFGPSCIEPALTDKRHPRVTPTATRDVAWGSYDDTFNTLESLLKEGPWVLGEKFSAADVYIGSALAWALSIQALDARTVFTDYVARLRERPAYQRMWQQCSAQIERLKKGSASQQAHA